MNHVLANVFLFLMTLATLLIVALMAGQVSGAEPMPTSIGQPEAHAATPSRIRSSRFTTTRT